MKILIIDDDADVIDITRKTLEFNGYEVIYALDGKSGMEKAKNEIPDLIILDIMMPIGPNGYTVCEKIKTDPATKDIPVIMLSARDMGDDLEKALEKKADWYIAKPYDANYLLKNVKKLIQDKINRNKIS